MMRENKPIIGITMGDIAGVGAEIIVKALSDKKIADLANFVVYGTDCHLCNAAKISGVDKFWQVIPIDSLDYTAIKGVVVADYSDYPLIKQTPRPTELSGRASLEFCEDAINAALKGDIDAITTAPINKISWKLAGSKYPGHTELLADKCHTDEKAMMFIAGKMRLALVTIHEALFDVRAKLDIESVCRSTRLLSQTLTDYFQIKSPVIAVAALNPHGGEGGRFGDEELRIISPAIEALKAENINAVGPFPADSLFLKASKGEYDGVIAMYHDQGMIPIKLLAFTDAVNVTIGLPIVRTSPAHGTAFDIAGTGKVDASSMKRAIETAVLMAKSRK